VIVLSIDPGPAESGIVTFNAATQRLYHHAVEPNETIIHAMRPMRSEAHHLAIEMIASYGMSVGAEVFETCVWIGRFVESWGQRWSKVYRREVKMHLCGTPAAKDTNVRQALIDRFGPGKSTAIGLKNSPGPLYGVKSHQWAALAVAVTWSDQQARYRRS
jgi:hypothetical protein